MTEENLGLRLKALRKKHYLTTRALAEKLGVSNGIISRWCNDTAYPSRKHIEDICDYFDVDKIWFVYGYNEKDFQTTEAINHVYELLSTDNKKRVLEVAKAFLASQLRN